MYLFVKPNLDEISYPYSIISISCSSTVLPESNLTPEQPPGFALPFLELLAIGDIWDLIALSKFLFSFSPHCVCLRSTIYALMYMYAVDQLYYLQL